MLYAMASAFAGGGAFIMVLVMAAVFGPSIESRYAPVIAHATFVIVDKGDEGGMTFEMTGEKLRQCTPIEITAMAFVNEKWVRADIRRPDEGVLMTSRLVGQQIFGVFEAIPPGRLLRLQFRHRCHFAWDSITTLPPIPVPEVKLP